MKTKFSKLAASLMPGIFLIGYNIGTGSLTAMSKAGANFGTDLLWAVLLSCLITWFLINFFSRFICAIASFSRSFASRFATRYLSRSSALIS